MHVYSLPNILLASVQALDCLAQLAIEQFWQIPNGPAHLVACRVNNSAVGDKKIVWKKKRPASCGLPDVGTAQLHGPNIVNSLLIGPL